MGDAQRILRKVFDAYDTNNTGELECAEFSSLLSDYGRVPRTRQESEELAALVYSCRASGAPGPLSFPEFVLLARRLDDMDVDAQSDDHAIGSPRATHKFSNLCSGQCK